MVSRMHFERHLYIYSSPSIKSGHEFESRFERKIEIAINREKRVKRGLGRNV